MPARVRTPFIAPTRGRIRVAAIAAAVCGFMLAPATLGASQPRGAGAVSSDRPQDTRPNILLLVADDQTYEMFNRSLMPTTFSELVDKGVTFDRAYVNGSLCCPSRSQIFTGLYEHHTGVDENTVKLSRPTVTQALHSAGYRTAIAGKYLNSVGCQTRSEFDQWVCLRQSAESGIYRNPTLIVNGVLQKYRGYTTDILANFTASFIASTPSNRPFFAMYTPISPHLPGADPRCKDLPVGPHRPPSFDEPTDTDGKPLYMQRGPLSPTEIATMDDDFGRMSRASACLDSSIGTILSSLGDRENDTLVIYMSDNGFLFGEHRWGSKEVPYEESVHVPFVIRYPAMVPESAPFATEALVQNVDIAPTIAGLAGIPWGADGLSLTPILSRQAQTIRTAALLEACEGATYPCAQARPQEEGIIFVPSFMGLVTDQYKYVEYVTGEKELYDLLADPYELVNLSGDPRFTHTENDLASELSAMTGPPPIETTIVSGPAPYTKPGSVPFVFFSQSRFATYQCRLDRGSTVGTWSACNSQRFVAHANADGSYTFEVAGTDEFLNIDTTPAAWSFVVDGTLPVASITSGPADPTTETVATFAFDSNEAGTSFTCVLDGAAPTDCSSGVTYMDLALGAHVFKVTPTDLAGNVGVAVQWSWTITQ